MSGSGGRTAGGGGGGGGGAGGASAVRFPSDSDAARAAREEANAMFRTADQLGRLPVFLAECVRKKGAIEAQLSSAVRTQVDETRLGLQLLNDAAAMMTRMRHNFHAIDAYCKDCKSVLRDTPEIQRVNTARKNLDATTRLLDKFRSLPAQAEALLEELDEKDRAIKHVYKRMRLLFRLRDSAMDQPSGGTLPGPGGAGGFSADFLSQLQENFEELTRSADEVEARVWENMSDAVFLAKDDPVTLVRTLEVIEMEDRAMRKVFGAARKDAPVAGGGEKARGVGHAPIVLSGDRASQLSMREKALNVLEKSIADLFNHLHIDEEQSAEQERKAEKEKKAKQAKIDEARAKAKKEEEQRRREAAARARRADGDDEDDDGGGGDGESDVDEPEELPSPPFDKLGRARGLFPSDDEADADGDDADGGKDSAGPSDYILNILEEMTDLVENLPPILAATVPCFPPDYNLPAFYIERYCRWMKLTLSFHCNEPAKLSKKAQLKAVNWVEWYRGELRKWESLYPGTTPLRKTAARALVDAGDDLPGALATAGKKARAEAARKEAAEAAFLDDLVRELMRAYTASTTDTLLKLCDNILRAEETADAELDAEGRYITSGPADLFYTINSTIEIVLQSFGLNAQPLSHVCLMVADIFNTYQNAQLRFLREVEMDDDVLFFGPDRIRKDDTFFCAVINNCSASQNHMDDLKDKVTLPQHR